MRIRTQLIVAAFLLAVVPLAAIVTYSYHSSRRALESAYRREADRLTGQMDRRLTQIRAELDQRLAVVSALPIPDSKHPAGGEVGNIVTVMGDAASLVDALEFEPVQARTGAADRSKDASIEARRNAQQVARALRAEKEARLAETAVTAPEPKGEIPEAPEAPVLPETPRAAEGAAVAMPIVIDIPAVPVIPRYVTSEQQRDLIGEISSLAEKLNDPSVTPEEREDLAQEMAATQKQLHQVVTRDRERFRRQIVSARAVLRAPQRDHAAPVPPSAQREAPPAAPAVASASAPAAAEVVTPAPQVRALTPTEAKRSKAGEAKTTLILGKPFTAAVRKEGAVVGQITARVSAEQVIRRVLGNATEDRSELPFAVDRQGTLYTRTDADKAKLEQLGIARRVQKGESTRGIDGWIVSTSTDPQSGLRIGVARPVGDNLDDLRKAAGRNFMLGMSLIALALIGIVPLSSHLTRDVKAVTDGAQRIAQGDLMTRLPVKSDNELGQLARTFNQMAADLSLQQERLLQQERTRKEQELQQRLLAMEYERKSVELEDARTFQLSMLPKDVPQHPDYQVAVYTRTATEVGGDYYDFHLADDVLSLTIGDATGHGAKAGTMVTVIKTLFAGYTPSTPPSAFLSDAAEKIKRMDLGRMAMALSLVRFDGKRLTYASAGMPPLLIHRAAERRVEEVALGATPLGTLGVHYEETSLQLASGDTILLLSDGFPELMSDGGQQLGYGAALDAFADAANHEDAAGVVASLVAAARQWHGDTPPNDDVTFVVVRVA